MSDVNKNKPNDQADQDQDATDTTNQRRQIYHREDYEQDPEDAKPFHRSRQDGWENLGNGGYWKQIPGADAW